MLKTDIIKSKKGYFLSLIYYEEVGDVEVENRRGLL